MKYKGYKNYNAWSIATWLSGSVRYYQIANGLINEYGNKDQAARVFLSYLPEKTPDGVKFTYSNVRAALAGI